MDGDVKVEPSTTAVLASAVPFATAVLFELPLNIVRTRGLSVTIGEEGRRLLCTEGGGWGEVVGVSETVHGSCIGRFTPTPLTVTIIAVVFVPT